MGYKNDVNSTVETVVIAALPREMSRGMECMMVRLWLEWQRWGWEEG